MLEEEMDIQGVSGEYTMNGNCEHLNKFYMPIIWNLGGNAAISEALCLGCGNMLTTFIPYGYYQLECPFGHTESYMRYVDKYMEEENPHCVCGEPIYFLRTIEEVVEPGVIIDWIEGELENMNHHDNVQLVGKLYGALVKRFGNHLEIANILRKTFLCQQ